jgi:hypothetical protein
MESNSTNDKTVITSNVEWYDEHIETPLSTKRRKRIELLEKENSKLQLQLLELKNKLKELSE